MERATPHVDPVLLRRLTSRLGYATEVGYVDLNGPELPLTACGSSSELRRARDGMDVVGAFCLRVHQVTGPLGERRLRPIVYLAAARDDKGAKEVHRKVWSQGIAPFLLVVTPTGVWVCNALTFSSKNWLSSEKSVPLSAIESSTILDQFDAKRLRASISWRDFAAAPEGRVDSSLLRSLNDLSRIFRNRRYGAQELPPLDAPLANALMGRLLYVYFLRDRGILTPGLLHEWGLRRIDLDRWDSRWPIDEMWDFFDKLDVPFNGSIFKIDEADRLAIHWEHVQVIREVMRHGFAAGADGVQLSFVDIYFPALRTETMSAVYEQFLHEEDPQRRIDEGTYYTRPFLADYVLDRIDDLLTSSGSAAGGIIDGVRILDGAAGSGIFLVGAYRRMIESALQQRRNTRLPLSELQRILCDNIFAIELRGAACHVAAFSLYLTLLDYVDKNELELVTHGSHEKKLFPPLVGSNILVRDLFETGPLPPQFPTTFECVVGNPPWSKLTLLSPNAQTYHERHPEWPVDADRGAELFAWKCAKEHLKEGGVMGMLLPAKSFLSPSASTFAPRFAKELHIEGIANLGHFRRVLFPDTEAAAVAMFVTKRTPDPRGWMWVHAPTLANQPTAKDGTLLDILVDRADVSVFRYAAVGCSSRSWFETLMLRPIDRKALEYFEDRCAIGQAITFGGLEKKLGLRLRGGESARRIGVSDEYVYHKGGVPKELSASLWKKLDPKYRSLFGGNVLLLTRTGQVENFYEQRLAFATTFIGIFFEQEDKPGSKARVRFLRALERYVRSEFFVYMLAIYGRQWLLDSRRFDTKDLLCVPVPFVTLDDERISIIENTPDTELNNALCDLFALPSDIRGAIIEYSTAREGFKNACLPAHALDEPTSEAISKYEAALQKRLVDFVGGRGSFKIAIDHASPPRSLSILDIFYTPAKPHLKKEKLAPALAAALHSYDSAGASIFTDTLFIHTDPKVLRALVVKSRLGYLWTNERAFADGATIVNAFLKISPVNRGAPSP